MKKLIFIILTVLLAFAFVSCGKTTVEISEDGYWVINGVKTDVLAAGEKGDKGDSASDENPQGLDFFLKDDGTYAVGIGSAIFLSNIDIPATYNGKAVTEIAERGFQNPFGKNKNPLKRISIPSSITVIGAYAFNGCEKLESITIPDSVTSIGDSAFDLCFSLTDVYYTGSEAEWAEIAIYDSNYYLTNAAIHYNYVSEG